MTMLSVSYAAAAAAMMGAALLSLSQIAAVLDDHHPWRITIADLWACVLFYSSSQSRLVSQS
jgi:hypothetical protein